MPGYQQHIKYVLITGRQGGGKLNPSGSVLHLFFGEKDILFLQSIINTLEGRRHGQVCWERNSSTCLSFF